MWRETEMIIHEGALLTPAKEESPFINTSARQRNNEMITVISSHHARRQHSE